MSGDSSWELQQAVYGALTGDSTLMAMITGVHDHVPQETAFPYVTMGESTTRDWRTGGVVGAEVTLVLHIWSRSRGRKQIKQIMSEIRRILEGATLTIAGHALVWLRFTSSQANQDPDGLTYHGITTFRAVTHEI